MTKIEALEREIEKLTPEELAAFREWFVEYDWHAWEREIEKDIAAGKLDKFGAEALEEFKRGKTWRHFESLPPEVQRLAHENFELLKSDPRHPSLQFKRD